MKNENLCQVSLGSRTYCFTYGLHLRVISLTQLSQLFYYFNVVNICFLSSLNTSNRKMYNSKELLIREFLLKVIKLIKKIPQHFKFTVNNHQIKLIKLKYCITVSTWWLRVSLEYDCEMLRRYRFWTSVEECLV